MLVIVDCTDCTTGRSLDLERRSMIDRGLFLTLQAIRRQLRAMPCELYLVRLIHHATGRAFPGERLWTAEQLSQPATVRFLRIRNREGCDVYFQPFAGNQNAGYILVDLDHAEPSVLEAMRSHGHEPCVVLESSPGHRQVWIRVSAGALEPALATAIGRYLARCYGGDPASVDWRHLGRLAGFTNQKPARRLPNGYGPWVQLRYCQPGWATCGAALLEQARQQVSRTTPDGTAQALAGPTTTGPLPARPTAAPQIYQAWLHRLRIPQRFPQPDWSIADKWVAKELLRGGVPRATVAAIVQGGSPGFPRRHADPLDYLRRTIARACQELAGTGFPSLGAPCVDAHSCLPERGAGTAGTSS
jgi:hypothetical protein